MAKAARMEERTPDRKAVARKEAKGKRKVARERPEHVGRVARQDILQLGAGKNIAESAENEEDLQAWCLLDQSSVTVERGEQSQFESEEDCGGEGQVGENQSHHGLQSRRSCDA